MCRGGAAPFPNPPIRHALAAGASACSGSLCSPGSYGPPGKPGVPRDSDVAKAMRPGEIGACAHRGTAIHSTKCAHRTETRWGRVESVHGRCTGVCLSCVAGQGRFGSRTPSLSSVDLTSARTVNKPPSNRGDAVVGCALLSVPGRILCHRRRRASQRRTAAIANKDQPAHHSSSRRLVSGMSREL